MTVRPFEGWRPATDDQHARWILDALVPPPPITVRFRVPSGYESVLRIQHRLHDGRRWANLYPDAARRAGSPFPPEPYDLAQDVEGEFAGDDADGLAATLCDATGDDRVHVALWEGWGWLHPGATSVAVFAAGPDARRAQADAAREHADRMRVVYDFVDRCPSIDWWGGRPMILFDGRLGDLASIGSPWLGSGLSRQSPQWWWPPDRSWFVATEIDDPCTYVAGPARLIERVEALPFETVRVRDTDPW